MSRRSRDERYVIPAGSGMGGDKVDVATVRTREAVTVAADTAEASGLAEAEVVTSTGDANPTSTPTTIAIERVRTCDTASPQSSKLVPGCRAPTACPRGTLGDAACVRVNYAEVVGAPRRRRTRPPAATSRESAAALVGPRTGATLCRGSPRDDPIAAPRHARSDKSITWICGSIVG